MDKGLLGQTFTGNITFSPCVVKLEPYEGLPFQHKDCDGLQNVAPKRPSKALTKAEFRECGIKESSVKNL